MAVRADEQVTAVVREQVEQHVGVFSPGDDEAVFVAHLRCMTERTVVLVRLLAVLDVDKTVRCPQPLEFVRHPGEVRPGFHRVRHRRVLLVRFPVVVEA
ncbi:hypothetical protein GCM10008097_02910 [Mycetocola manganoxydans]|nr:hypothetical protein GCM10008097_02910 [Mycetocola manganoxydans]